MQLFAYSESWADTVAAQIGASHGTRCVGAWGYGCVVIGRDFEDIVERHWLEVDRLSGRYLHVFCLVSPPMGFIGDRIAQLRSSPQTEDTRYAIGLLEDAMSVKVLTKERQLNEKERLLRDLAQAGLVANESADFLFFDFRNEGDNVIIDVIAAKAARMGSDAGDQDYLRCFRQLADLACKAYHKNASAAEFSKMVDSVWTRRLMMTKAPNLLTYITGFIDALRKAV